MVCAKNYETVSTFVKVIQRKLLASFFSGHGVYPPKIRPGKFLWSKNDVLMVIDLILHYSKFIPPPKQISGYAPAYMDNL